jgi:hypothetical protein
VQLSIDLQANVPHMLRLIVAILLVAALPFCGMGQYAIKGVALDTLNNIPQRSASVVLFYAKDSVIAAYTRTSPSGEFSINMVDSGSYIIRVSSPGFAEYLDVITLSKPLTDIGIVPMVSNEHVLKEFVITRQIAAIKIKGDTTEYMADSFRTRDNATVEDLLKKLPGIQVDKNGKITAQGTEVKKILVDGEEFFSDDPKVVTKGLQADALNKVQVFDKKSDQAEFTGIDDGEKTKTINLELKEDKKKGFFGKIDAGGGNQGYFQNQGMVNAFKGKRQVSVFGIMSNTDKAGLGWNDGNKFSGGNNYIYSDDGDMMMPAAGNGDRDFAGWNGKYEGEGLPKTWTNGAHFADKWQKDKYHLSGNYRFARQNVELSGENTSQYVLPDNKGFVQLAEKNQFSSTDRNGLDALFEMKIDSNTSIKISADGGNKFVNSSSIFTTVSVNEDLTPRNLNLRTIKSNVNATYLNSSFLLRKKFAKPGRSLSLDVRENYNVSRSIGYLLSYIEAADTGITGTVSTRTNQLKDNTSRTFLFSTKAVYTEPIYKKTMFLEFSYLLTTNYSVAKFYSFDSTGVGEYNSVNDTFTSNYVFRVTNNRAGANYRYTKDKFNFSFGSDISHADFQQYDFFNTRNLNRSYWNVFPAASLSYSIKKQTSISFNYRGNTRQPTIDQVQTLQQNTDPLNITEGNPNLRQEFANRFSLRFNDYKMLSSRYTYLSVSYRTVSDAISSNIRASADGNRTQFINVDGNYSADIYASRGAKIKNTGIYLGGHATGSLNHIINLINDTANINNNNSYGIGPTFDFEIDDKLEISLNSEVTFNDNRSSISSFSSSYRLLSTDLSASLELTQRLELGSSVDYMARQRTEIFDQNNNVIRWNAYASMKFLKKKNLVLQASIYDILNQNLGFSRESQNGIIRESRYNTIRRYALVNLVWNFTYSPVGEPKKADE